MPDDNGIFMEFAQALEPPKRGPGRPAGSKNKKTLEMEAKMAKKAGQKLADEAKKKKGKNAEEVEFTMKVLAIADQADQTDINSLKACFIRYIQLCRDSDHKIGNMAAYSSIGIDLKTAQNWTSPENRRKNAERAEMIDAINKICALYRESMISAGSVDKITGIFWQKSLDGLRDDAPAQTDSGPGPDAGKSPDAIAAKYKNLPKA